jgi:hypothetical protein
MAKNSPQRRLCCAVKANIPSAGDQAVTMLLELPSGIIYSCLVPSDYIPIRSWPLFRAEVILRSMIESHQHQESKS